MSLFILGLLSCVSILIPLLLNICLVHDAIAEDHQPVWNSVPSEFSDNTVYLVLIIHFFPSHKKDVRLCKQLTNVLMPQQAKQEPLK